MAVTNPTFVNSEGDDIGVIRMGFAALEADLESLLPDGRRKDIALTHLETAAMYAYKAVYEK